MYSTYLSKSILESAPTVPSTNRKNPLTLKDWDCKKIEHRILFDKNSMLAFLSFLIFPFNVKKLIPPFSRVERIRGLHAIYKHCYRHSFHHLLQKSGQNLPESQEKPYSPRPFQKEPTVWFFFFYTCKDTINKESMQTLIFSYRYIRLRNVYKRL